MCDKTTDPILTDYDITINAIHQDNMFKGTITVCIIYAVFAFILIGLAYVFDNIRELLFDKFLPFTLIYIIGTIIIIMIFIYFIVSFKPRKIEKTKVSENVSCPDYWKLEVLDDNVINKSFDVENYNKNLFKYRCVMDENIFDKKTIYSQDKQDNASNLYRMGNISPYYTGHKGTDYTGVYDNGRFNDIKNNIDNKSAYLYKDVKSYVGTNLSYDGISNSNIYKDLRDAAFIMNNYKAVYNKKDLMGYSNIFNEQYSDTAAKNGKHRIYYDTPPALTWATNNVTTTNTTISTNSTTVPAIGTVSTTYKYSATVYDWNNTKDKITDTFGTKIAINVYIIDTEIAAVNNFVKVGIINNDPIKDNRGNILSEQLYFESVHGIVFHAVTGGATLFSTNKTFYFPDTWLTTEDLKPESNYSKTTLETANKYIKGPKIRLFNIKERVVAFNDSGDGNTEASQNFTSSIVPLTCSAVYPSLLASKEPKYEYNNTLRCAYAKVCNIPWSDMNCNDIIPYASS
jgi:hypothetical protein